MHIVLEGPDNGGKTTLSQQLRRLVPKLVYFHPGGPPKTFYEEAACVDKQLAILKETTPHIIDRITPISQYVYNRKFEMDKARMEWLTYYVRRPDVLIIYCRPSTDRLLRVQDITWAEHDTEEMKQKVLNNMHQIVRDYDLLMTAVPCLHYNFEEEGSDRLVTNVALAISGDHNAKQLIQRMMTAGGM